MDFFRGLFRADFLPHGWCYKWDPEVVWLHVTSDLLIALAYYFIPFSLIYIVRRRNDLVYPWIFWLFGIFIIACGTTHLMNVLVVWQPWYRLDGLIKLLTALASVPTAIVMLRLAPAIVALPGPMHLRVLNAQLEKEVADRRAAEAEVRRLNAELEARVEERTRELRESENRLRAILDSTPLLVYLKDRQGYMMFVNNEFEKEFQMDRKEIIGKLDRDLFPHNALAAHFSSDDQLWEERRPASFEIPAVHTGEQQTYMVVKFPLYGEGDRPYGLCAMAADITERKRAELDLRRYTEDLQQFAFIAAHDLQEPLRNVKTYSQLLSRRYSGKLDREAEQILGYITTGVDRMYQLVDALQAYSELDRPHQRVRTVPAETVLRDTLKNMELTLRAAGAEVELSELPSVRVDPVQMGQVFQNLISNALKYRSEAAPRIRVSATRSGPDWEFSVKDNGIGIDMQYAEQIFGLFRRLHGRDIPGTGIGLAIVKRVVTAHGGRVWVVSAPGEGADFRFTLPAT